MAQVNEKYLDTFLPEHQTSFSETLNQEKDDTAFSEPREQNENNSPKVLSETGTEQSSSSENSSDDDGTTRSEEATESQPDNKKTQNNIDGSFFPDKEVSLKLKEDSAAKNEYGIAKKKKRKRKSYFGLKRRSRVRHQVPLTLYVDAEQAHSSQLLDPSAQLLDHNSTRDAYGSISSTGDNYTDSKNWDFGTSIPPRHMTRHAMQTMGSSALSPSSGQNSLLFNSSGLTQLSLSSESSFSPLVNSLSLQQNDLSDSFHQSTTGSAFAMMSPLTRTFPHRASTLSYTSSFQTGNTKQAIDSDTSRKSGSSLQKQYSEEIEFESSESENELKNDLFSEQDDEIKEKHLSRNASIHNDQIYCNNSSISSSSELTQQIHPSNPLQTEKKMDSFLNSGSDTLGPSVFSPPIPQPLLKSHSFHNDSFSSSSSSSLSSEISFDPSLLSKKSSHFESTVNKSPQVFSNSSLLRPTIQTHKPSTTRKESPLRLNSPTHRSFFALDGQSFAESPFEPRIPLFADQYSSKGTFLLFSPSLIVDKKTADERGERKKKRRKANGEKFERNILAKNEEHQSNLISDDKELKQTETQAELKDDMGRNVIDEPATNERIHENIKTATSNEKQGNSRNSIFSEYFKCDFDSAKAQISLPDIDYVPLPSFFENKTIKNYSSDELQQSNNISSSLKSARQIDEAVTQAPKASNASSSSSTFSSSFSSSSSSLFSLSLSSSLPYSVASPLLLNTQPNIEATEEYALLNTTIKGLLPSASFFSLTFRLFEFCTAECEWMKLSQMMCERMKQKEQKEQKEGKEPKMRNGESDEQTSNEEIAFENRKDGRWMRSSGQPDYYSSSMGSDQSASTLNSNKSSSKLNDPSSSYSKSFNYPQNEASDQSKYNLPISFTEAEMTSIIEDFHATRKEREDKVLNAIVPLLHLPLSSSSIASYNERTEHQKNGTYDNNSVSLSQKNSISSLISTREYTDVEKQYMKSQGFGAAIKLISFLHLEASKLFERNSVLSEKEEKTNIEKQKMKEDLTSFEAKAESNSVLSLDLEHSPNDSQPSATAQSPLKTTPFALPSFLSHSSKLPVSEEAIPPSVESSPVQLGVESAALDLQNKEIDNTSIETKEKIEKNVQNAQLLNDNSLTSKDQQSAVNSSHKSDDNQKQIQTQKQKRKHKKRTIPSFISSSDAARALAVYQQYVFLQQHQYFNVSSQADKSDSTKVSPLSSAPSSVSSASSISSASIVSSSSSHSHHKRSLSSSAHASASSSRSSSPSVLSDSEQTAKSPSSLAPSASVASSNSPSPSPSSANSADQEKQSLEDSQRPNAYAFLAAKKCRSSSSPSVLQDFTAFFTFLPSSNRPTPLFSLVAHSFFHQLHPTLPLHLPPLRPYPSATPFPPPTILSSNLTLFGPSYRLAAENSHNPPKIPSLRMLPHPFLYPAVLHSASHVWIGTSALPSSSSSSKNRLSTTLFSPKISRKRSTPFSLLSNSNSTSNSQISCSSHLNSLSASFIVSALESHNYLSTSHNLSLLSTSSLPLSFPNSDPDGFFLLNAWLISVRSGNEGGFKLSEKMIFEEAQIREENELSEIDVVVSRINSILDVLAPLSNKIRVMNEEFAHRKKMLMENGSKKGAGYKNEDDRGMGRYDEKEDEEENEASFPPVEEQIGEGNGREEGEEGEGEIDVDDTKWLDSESETEDQMNKQQNNVIRRNSSMNFKTTPTNNRLASSASFDGSVTPEAMSQSSTPISTPRATRHSTSPFSPFSPILSPSRQSQTSFTSPRLFSSPSFPAKRRLRFASPSAPANGRSLRVANKLFKPTAVRKQRSSSRYNLSPSSRTSFSSNSSSSAASLGDTRMDSHFIRFFQNVAQSLCNLCIQQMKRSFTPLSWKTIHQLFGSMQIAFMTSSHHPANSYVSSSSSSLTSSSASSYQIPPPVSTPPPSYNSSSSSLSSPSFSVISSSQQTSSIATTTLFDEFCRLLRVESLYSLPRVVHRMRQAVVALTDLRILSGLDWVQILKGEKEKERERERGRELESDEAMRAILEKPNENYGEFWNLKENENENEKSEEKRYKNDNSSGSVLTPHGHHGNGLSSQSHRKKSEKDRQRLKPTVSAPLLLLFLYQLNSSMKRLSLFYLPPLRPILAPIQSEAHKQLLVPPPSPAAPSTCVISHLPFASSSSSLTFHYSNKNSTETVISTLNNSLHSSSNLQYPSSSSPFDQTTSSSLPYIASNTSAFLSGALPLPDTFNRFTPPDLHPQPHHSEYYIPYISECSLPSVAFRLAMELMLHVWEEKGLRLVKAEEAKRKEEEKKLKKIQTAKNRNPQVRTVWKRRARRFTPARRKSTQAEKNRRLMKKKEEEEKQNKKLMLDGLDSLLKNSPFGIQSSFPANAGSYQVDLGVPPSPPPQGNPTFSFGNLPCSGHSRSLSPISPSVFGSMPFKAKLESSALSSSSSANQINNPSMLSSNGPISSNLLTTAYSCEQTTSPLAVLASEISSFCYVADVVLRWFFKDRMYLQKKKKFESQHSASPNTNSDFCSSFDSEGDSHIFDSNPTSPSLPLFLTPPLFALLSSLSSLLRTLSRSIDVLSDVRCRPFVVSPPLRFTKTDENVSFSDEAEERTSFDEKKENEKEMEKEENNENSSIQMKEDTESTQSQQIQTEKESNDTESLTTTQLLLPPLSPLNIPFDPLPDKTLPFLTPTSLEDSEWLFSSKKDSASAKSVTQTKNKTKDLSDLRSKQTESSEKVAIKNTECFDVKENNNISELTKDHSSVKIDTKQLDTSPTNISSSESTVNTQTVVTSDEQKANLPQTLQAKQELTEKKDIHNEKTEEHDEANSSKRNEIKDKTFNKSEKSIKKQNISSVRSIFNPALVLLSIPFPSLGQLHMSLDEHGNLVDDEATSTIRHSLLFDETHLNGNEVSPAEAFRLTRKMRKEHNYSDSSESGYEKENENENESENHTNLRKPQMNTDEEEEDEEEESDENTISEYSSETSDIQSSKMQKKNSSSKDQKEPLANNGNESSSEEFDIFENGNKCIARRYDRVEWYFYSLAKMFRLGFPVIFNRGIALRNSLYSSTPPQTSTHSPSLSNMHSQPFTFTSPIPLNALSSPQPSQSYQYTSSSSFPSAMSLASSSSSVKSPSFASSSSSPSMSSQRSGQFALNSPFSRGEDHTATPQLSGSSVPYSPFAIDGRMQPINPNYPYITQNNVESYEENEIDEVEDDSLLEEEEEAAAELNAQKMLINSLYHEFCRTILLNLGDDYNNQLLGVEREVAAFARDVAAVARHAPSMQMLQLFADEQKRVQMEAENKQNVEGKKVLNSTIASSFIEKCDTASTKKENGNSFSYSIKLNKSNASSLLPSSSTSSSVIIKMSHSAKPILSQNRPSSLPFRIETNLPLSRPLITTLSQRLKTRSHNLSSLFPQNQFKQLKTPHFSSAARRALKQANELSQHSSSPSIALSTTPSSVYLLRCYAILRQSHELDFLSQLSGKSIVSGMKGTSQWWLGELQALAQKLMLGEVGYNNTAYASPSLVTPSSPASHSSTSSSSPSMLINGNGSNFNGIDMMRSLSACGEEALQLMASFNNILGILSITQTDLHLQYQMHQPHLSLRNRAKLGADLFCSSCVAFSRKASNNRNMPDLLPLRADLSKAKELNESIYLVNKPLTSAALQTLHISRIQTPPNTDVLISFTSSPAFRYLVQTPTSSSFILPVESSERKADPQLPQKLIFSHISASLRSLSSLSAFTPLHFDLSETSHLYHSSFLKESCLSKAGNLSDNFYPGHSSQPTHFTRLRRSLSQKHYDVSPSQPSFLSPSPFTSVKTLLTSPSSIASTPTYCALSSPSSYRAIEELPFSVSSRQTGRANVFPFPLISSMDLPNLSQHDTSSSTSSTSSSSSQSASTTSSSDMQKEQNKKGSSAPFSASPSATSPSPSPTSKRKASLSPSNSFSSPQRATSTPSSPASLSPQPFSATNATLSPQPSFSSSNVAFCAPQTISGKHHSSSPSSSPSSSSSTAFSLASAHGFNRQYASSLPFVQHNLTAYMIVLLNSLIPVNHSSLIVGKTVLHPFNSTSTLNRYQNVLQSQLCLLDFLDKKVNAALTLHNIHSAASSFRHSSTIISNKREKPVLSSTLSTPPLSNRRLNVSHVPIRNSSKQLKNVNQHRKHTNPIAESLTALTSSSSAAAATATSPQTSINSTTNLSSLSESFRILRARNTPPIQSSSISLTGLSPVQHGTQQLSPTALQRTKEVPKRIILQRHSVSPSPHSSQPKPATRSSAKQMVELSFSSPSSATSSSLSPRSSNANPFPASHSPSLSSPSSLRSLTNEQTIATDSTASKENTQSVYSDSPEHPPSVGSIALPSDSKLNINSNSIQKDNQIALQLPQNSSLASLLRNQAQKTTPLSTPTSTTHSISATSSSNPSTPLSTASSTRTLTSLSPQSSADSHLLSPTFTSFSSSSSLTTTTTTSPLSPSQSGTLHQSISYDQLAKEQMSAYPNPSPHPNSHSTSSLQQQKILQLQIQQHMQLQQEQKQRQQLLASHQVPLAFQTSLALQSQTSHQQFLKTEMQSQLNASNSPIHQMLPSHQERSQITSQANTVQSSSATSSYPPSPSSAYAAIVPSSTSVPSSATAALMPLRGSLQPFTATSPAQSSALRQRVNQMQVVSAASAASGTTGTSPQSSAKHLPSSPSASMAIQPSSPSSPSSQMGIGSLAVNPSSSASASTSSSSPSLKTLPVINNLSSIMTQQLQPQLLRAMTPLQRQQLHQQISQRNALIQQPGQSQSLLNANVSSAFSSSTGQTTPQSSTIASLPLTALHLPSSTQTHAPDSPSLITSASNMLPSSFAFHALPPNLHGILTNTSSPQSLPPSPSSQTRPLIMTTSLPPSSALQTSASAMYQSPISQPSSVSPSRLSASATPPTKPLTFSPSQQQQQQFYSYSLTRSPSLPFHPANSLATPLARNPNSNSSSPSLSPSLTPSSMSTTPLTTSPSLSTQTHIRTESPSLSPCREDEEYEEYVVLEPKYGYVPKGRSRKRVYFDPPQYVEKIRKRKVKKGTATSLVEGIIPQTGLASIQAQNNVPLTVVPNAAVQDMNGIVNASSKIPRGRQKGKKKARRSRRWTTNSRKKQLRRAALLAAATAAAAEGGNAGEIGNTNNGWIGEGRGSSANEIEISGTNSKKERWSNNKEDDGDSEGDEFLFDENESTSEGNEEDSHIKTKKKRDKSSADNKDEQADSSSNFLESDSNEMMFDDLTEKSQSPNVSNQHQGEGKSSEDSSSTATDEDAENTTVFSSEHTATESTESSPHLPRSPKHKKLQSSPLLSSHEGNGSKLKSYLQKQSTEATDDASVTQMVTRKRNIGASLLSLLQNNYSSATGHKKERLNTKEEDKLSSKLLKRKKKLHSKSTLKKSKDLKKQYIKKSQKESNKTEEPDQSYQLDAVEEAADFSKESDIHVMLMKDSEEGQDNSSKKRKGKKRRRTSKLSRRKGGKKRKSNPTVVGRAVASTQGIPMSSTHLLQGRRNGNGYSNRMAKTTKSVFIENDSRASNAISSPSSMKHSSSERATSHNGQHKSPTPFSLSPSFGSSMPSALSGSPTFVIPSSPSSLNHFGRTADEGYTVFSQRSTRRQARRSEELGNMIGEFRGKDILKNAIESGTVIEMSTLMLLSSVGDVLSSHDTKRGCRSIGATGGCWWNGTKPASGENWKEKNEKESLTSRLVSDGGSVYPLEEVEYFAGIGILYATGQDGIRRNRFRELNNMERGGGMHLSRHHQHKHEKSDDPDFISQENENDILCRSRNEGILEEMRIRREWIVQKLRYVLSSLLDAMKCRGWNSLKIEHVPHLVDTGAYEKCSNALHMSKYSLMCSMSTPEIAEPFSSSISPSLSLVQKQLNEGQKKDQVSKSSPIDDISSNLTVSSIDVNPSSGKLDMKQLNKNDALYHLSLLPPFVFKKKRLRNGAIKPFDWKAASQQASNAKLSTSLSFRIDSVDGSIIFKEGGTEFIRSRSGCFN
ncbi:uncharacterized protein MONOS_1026 [Monocercomonoides exilis]|uniref:uncharacterized protein n=1 Tax=Monocercomonoides exilis TaxID=2049356 RepID=UPI00355AAB29|nr:hypothetical protein MONOS_1026 [Monocercomonoides exilis]|eukprot:MONOS_1026.1-p1 / transcript=MONOS_1026.1 / gene=MONOS_1026 / organism=Monocercomonoides_exilis_PA203 / gene_product=unspecified product / transcript_product=unspecified product / location=Mono_scaffold00017:99580-117827(-) / protein_length=5971 / sequence_SO=supercontig / SO=protein_coding / is_pseudo=false